MLCWVPFFQVPYSRPSTFACPGCPTIPLFGLTINGYLLSQCRMAPDLGVCLRDCSSEAVGKLLYAKRRPEAREYIFFPLHGDMECIASEMV